jgi:uncharacterized membrane protein
MKGGLFTKRINLPVMSILLAMLVVLFAGWLLFTLGKREGYKALAESMDSIESSKPSESSEEVVVADKKPEKPSEKK